MPITLTSRYSPLTYDEITKPLIEQTQVQDALENAYMEASTQAAQLMSQANQQTDPVAYARLKNYSDALQQQADALMRNGLNRNSKHTLMNMRKQYAQDIIPVQTAIERRNTLAEERRKAGPDYLWERDVLNLDDLLQNPQADYGTYYNGAMITKRVADAVKAVADSMANLEATGHLTPYHIKALETHGFTPQEIDAAVAGGNDSKSLFLQGVRDRILNSIDVYNRGSQVTKDRALGYANEGLYAGIGSSKYSTVEDARAKAELAWEYRQKELDKTSGGGNGLSLQDLINAGQPKFSRRNVSTMVNENNQTKEASHRDYAVEKGYIRRSNTGEWEITDSGKAMIERQFQLTQKLEHPEKRSWWETDEMLSKEMRGLDTKFLGLLTSSGVIQYHHERPRSGGEVVSYTLRPNALEAIPDDMVSSPEAYDSNKATEYARRIPASKHEDVVSALNSAAPDGSIQGYEMSNNDGNYTLQKAKRINVSTLTKEDIKSVVYVAGKAGNYYQISLKGQDKKLIIPLAAFDANADVITKGNMGTIESYLEAQNAGYDYDEFGRPYSLLLNAEINSMMDNGLSVLGAYTPGETNVSNTFQQSTTSIY